MSYELMDNLWNFLNTWNPLCFNNYISNKKRVPVLHWPTNYVQFILKNLSFWTSHHQKLLLSLLFIQLVYRMQILTSNNGVWKCILYTEKYGIFILHLLMVKHRYTKEGINNKNYHIVWHKHFIYFQILGVSKLTPM